MRDIQLAPVSLFMAAERGLAAMADPAIVLAVGQALAGDSNFVTLLGGALDASVAAKLEERLSQASQKAEGTFNEVRIRMETIEKNMGKTLEEMKVAFTSVQRRMGILEQDPQPMSSTGSTRAAQAWTIGTGKSRRP